MSLLDSMPFVFQLRRPTSTTDTLGANLQVYADVGDQVPGWAQLASATEIHQAMQRDQVVTHKIYLEEDPGMAIGDALKVISTPDDVPVAGVIIGEQLKIRSFGDRSAGLGLLPTAMVDNNNTE